MLLDSGAFTEISTHGRYRHEPEVYAAEVRRLLPLLPACTTVVSQDMMCEPFILGLTGLTVADHQMVTVDRYDSLMRERLPAVVLPVLQGFQPEEYVRHIEMYGDRLEPNAWVGVGSVCKRNSSPMDIIAVLGPIKDRRPDLRLHGFGLKKTALMEGTIRSLLYSADSMAWSFAARYEGRDGNSWLEAERFRVDIEATTGRHSSVQLRLF